MSELSEQTAVEAELVRIEDFGKGIIEMAAERKISFPELCAGLAAVFATSLQVVDNKPGRIKVIAGFNALITKTAVHHGLI